MASGLYVLMNSERRVKQVSVSGNITQLRQPDDILHIFPDTTELPSDWHPSSNWMDKEGKFHTGPNPYAYKHRQQEVFTWARDNALSDKFKDYRAYGHGIRAQVFYSFSAMTVMAAMHKENLVGDLYPVIQPNLVDWLDFVHHVDTSLWRIRGGVHYNDMLSGTSSFYKLVNYLPVLNEDIVILPDGVERAAFLREVTEIFPVNFHV